MIDFNPIKQNIEDLINLIYEDLRQNDSTQFGENNYYTKSFFKPIFKSKNGYLLPEFKIQIVRKEVNLNYYQIDESYLSNFELFKEIIRLLQGELDFSEIFLKFTLISFIHNAVNSFTTNIDKRVLETQLNFLKDYLIEKQITVDVKVFYQDIYLQLEKISLSENLSLRRIQADDMIFETKKKLYEEFQELLRNPQCVLEYRFSKKYNKYDLESSLFEVDLQEELNILDYLMLFNKVGSVINKKTIIKRNFYSFGGIGPLESNIAPSIHFTNYISKEEIPKITRLMELLHQEEISKYLSFRRRDSKPLDIAINRYYNSFIFSENYQSCITNAVMSLEALFTENKPQLSRSLQQRLAILLKVLGFSPLSIESIVKDAYNIRSSYSHGSMSNKKHKKIKEITRQILEITRICLLIFLQIDNNLSDNSNLTMYYSKKFVNSLGKKRKQKLIKMLDKALLDKKLYKKINLFLNDNCVLIV